MTAHTALQNIPEELQSYPQWVCHDAAKRPINPHTGQLADVSDASTWATFDQARAAAEVGQAVGIGFVFTAGDPFVGIDLDVPEGGNPSEGQQRIYDAFNTYAEQSPSGRGLHIIAKGRVSEGGVRNSALGVEVYSSGRFFTFTGNALRKQPIADCQTFVDTLCAQIAPKRDTGTGAIADPCPAPQISDEALRERVFGSEANRKYYQGDVSDWSNAYFALICAVCLFSSDEAQVRRVVMASPLVQDAPPKGRETRAQKAERLWAKEYASAARRGAQERQGRLNVVIDLSGQLACALTPTAPQDDTARRSRFRVQHVSDLGDREPTYLIDGLIEERTYNVIYGGPGSGKTFGAIDQSACIATGQDYHGKAVRQGGVVYVLGEGVSGFNRRAKAWAVHSGIALTRDVPLFVVPAPIEMLNAADVNAACDAIAEATAGQTIKLICLDTLARNFGDGDENSTKDMNRFNAAVGNMMDRFSCAVIVVHHSGHENPNRARGSRSLLGAVDAEFRVDKDHDTVTLTHTKAKDGPEHAPITFGVEFIELGKRQSDGEPFGSLVLVERQAQTVKANKLTSAQQRAMKAFDDAAKTAGQFADDGSFIGVNRDEWRKAFYRIATQDNDDSKSKAFRRACADLVDKGELDVSDDVFSYAGQFAWVKNQAVTDTRTAGQDTDITGHVQSARP